MVEYGAHHILDAPTQEWSPGTYSGRTSPSSIDLLRKLARTKHLDAPSALHTTGGATRVEVSTLLLHLCNRRARCSAIRDICDKYHV